MKLLNARVKGLIGVYRGSDIKEIDIDFTKCKNRVTLIVGANGSGKSTLLSVLNPLPDQQSNYIQKEEGYKELIYSINDTVYKIFILYPVNKYGERTTTKAYISKSVNGEILELNPNGNVSSYKDCLYSEFRLDSNFASLTSISLEDKGIVNKTPSERKKFVGSIVSTVEVYNNIFKTLNKRSSVFKSMINSLVSKIDTIGDPNDIESSMKSIDKRIDTLSKDRDILIKKLSGAESMIQTLDPNNQIQSQYNKLYLQLTSIKGQIDTVNMFISKYMAEPYIAYIDDPKKCLENKNKMNTEILVLDSKIENLKDSLQTLLQEREEDSRTLNIKVNKVNSLRSQYNFEELFKQLKATNDRIKRFRDILHDLGLSEDTTLTKDEFILGLSTLKSIKEQVDTFRSFAYDNQISMALQYIENNVSITHEIDNISDNIETIKARIDSARQEKSYNKGLLEKTDILSKRPDSCAVDTCPFIEDALKAYNLNPKDKLNSLEEELQILLLELQDLNNKKKELETIGQVISSLNTIVNMIFNNKSILDKLPNGIIFTDIPSFYKNLRNGNTFDSILDLYNYIDCANLFEEYRIDKELLVKLQSEHEIYKNRNDIINEISADIEELQQKVSGVVKTIEDMNDKIFKLEVQSQEMKSLIQVISGMVDKYEELDKLQSDKESLEDNIRGMSMNMKAIEQAIQDINNINSSIINLDNELNPIKNDRESMKYKLSRLKEYYTELETYNAKFNKVEIVKKYSSPTKAGIQNLFIDVYMGQTRAMANELLSMFFGGKLRLLEYNINENEFKIPCTSMDSPLKNDDISSCSDGEKAIIAIVLSAALLQQSSTLYNILRLDEIDGTLDQSNRALFMDVLSIVMDILHMDNCLMISHASESSLENVDVIQLNMDGLSMPRGNIIYSI